MSSHNTSSNRTLTEPEARAYLAAKGLAMPPFSLAKTVDETVKAAQAIGYPVVMKVVSPQIVHKSEFGGVRVNLATPEAVRSAFDQLMAIKLPGGEQPDIHGCLVTSQVQGGLEVIIGSTQDRQFGPVVMFGLGGIFVEVFGDVSFGIAPLTDKEARAMIAKIKGYALLKGARGQAPRDLDALARLLVQVSEAVWQDQSILELDLNPVFALEQGVAVGDARILLKG